MGLPTVILPGYFASAIAYRQLEQHLQQQGFPTTTVPLSRRDWIPTLGGLPVTPILQQLDRTVKQVLQQSGCSQINLIGHSAGGWIARIYLGEKPYWIPRGGNCSPQTWGAHSSIATLVTLGTPHISQEQWTRQNLDFTNQNYPDAFHPNVQYICVAGKAVYGERRWGTWIAYNSYQLTCGTGNSWGDGITPIPAAHLKGAKNLTLDNVRHSPRNEARWYGSADVVSAWASYLS